MRIAGGGRMNHPCLDENRRLREESRALRDKLEAERRALRIMRERTARICEESRLLRESCGQSSRKS
jgi:hypothetical protein